MEREEKQVDVVRCKDCKHFADHVECCSVFNIPVCKNDFCGYAETADVAEVQDNG